MPKGDSSAACIWSTFGSIGHVQVKFSNRVVVIVVAVALSLTAFGGCGKKKGSSITETVVTTGVSVTTLDAGDTGILEDSMRSLDSDIADVDKQLAQTESDVQ